jgi:hypothetical protein
MDPVVIGRTVLIGGGVLIGEVGSRLVEMVEDWVQAHFFLRFGELSLIIHEDFSCPVVPAFDFLLSLAEKFDPPLCSPQLANLPIPVCSRRPVGGLQQLVIVSDELPNRSGIALPGTAAKQLQVDSS